jgi:hypothetical protein
MILQKHKTRKDKDYSKYVVVLPKEAVEKADFREGDELETEAKKGEIKLKRK